MTCRPLAVASRKIGSLSLRVVAIGWGALCVLLALQWFVDLGMSGFPDGYISPYARATSVPLHVLAWACMAQGLYFIVKGVVSRNMRARSLACKSLPQRPSPWRRCWSCTTARIQKRAATPIRRSPAR